MKRALRIGFVRIAQETNGLSPLFTEVESFERTHFIEGAELLERCGRWKAEAPGFTRNAELSGFVRAARKVGGGNVELVPLFSAWAVPGGPLSAKALEWFRARLVADLKAAGPLDGLFFSMHGAMTAEGHDEPEALFLEDCRTVLGDAPIAISLDLHAQLTPALVDNATILAAYRTNPHRDHFQVGYRAGEMLTKTVLGTVNPTVGWRTLPMVLGLLVFYAWCLQCAATVAVIKRETNSWRWPIASWLYMTALGYFGALTIFQLGS